MKVTWILQNGVFDENLLKLKLSLKEQGHKCVEVKYIPFNDKQYISDDLGSDGPVLFYGSLNLAKLIMRDLHSNALPGIFCNLNNMKCTSYYPYFGKWLINHDYTMLPFGEIDRLRPKLFDRFGVNEDIFIRPDSGFKTFSGSLLNQHESLNHFLAGHTVFSNEIVVVSSPKQIIQEWRLVVCGEKIVASSQYHKNGLLDVDNNVPKTVLQIGQSILDSTDYRPEKCFVMDIGKTINGGIGLVEINSFSCSGFYACDIDSIVKEASEQAIQYWEDMNCVGM